MKSFHASTVFLFFGHTRRSTIVVQTCFLFFCVGDSKLIFYSFPLHMFFKIIFLPEQSKNFYAQYFQLIEHKWKLRSTLKYYQRTQTMKSTKKRKARKKIEMRIERCGQETSIVKVGS